MPSIVSSVHLNQKHLDINSMKELPESHAWTTPGSDDVGSDSDFYLLSGSDSVPVIDLDHPMVMDHMGHACRTWGVFQVLNHHIDTKLLQDMESAGNSLFSLPIQTKLLAARPPDGVTGYGVARISSFFSKHMWSEGFTIFGSPTDHARSLWPHDYTKFCDLIKEYEDEMKMLSKRVMWLMLGSLGLSMDDVKWAEQSGSAAIQFNSYPSCPDPDRAMGLAAHTDSTLFTILYQSNTSGLQVQREKAKWLTVPPITGALVINIGDLFHILSNGSYPSILHRAVVNRTQHRLSIAFLYGPPANILISPISKLVDSSHPALFRAVTWSEYLGLKAKHFNKALSMVRVCANRISFM
ncbi:gibberellin 3-beta-dioxygenase 1-like [Impatiens glandulifera]|uniref:gibberellin 3-beta-dioxygenase 1-like n=1 Tax=Impatiens glandulifera TaxID=253017 RepID=UPI001FB0F46C|nr:gibberellin 3-beta-dioxygenase 1-like [Impatiens glandulifera]